MATYYFDANGATAGFGTLTGDWDNGTTALWSTSSAGTAVPAAVTVGTADSANFGFAGTSATAGTVTVANVTVTPNAIITANLAGLQTIAASGVGTINPGGTTPVINVGSAGGLTISAPIGGTTAWSKTGAETLTTSGTISTSAAITMSAGTWNLNGSISNSTGAFTVSAGTFTSAAAASIAKTITVNSGATATFNGAVTSVAGGLNGTVTLGSGSSLAIGGASANWYVGSAASSVAYLRTARPLTYTTAGGPAGGASSQASIVLESGGSLAGGVNTQLPVTGTYGHIRVESGATYTITSVDMLLRQAADSYAVFVNDGGTTSIGRNLVATQTAPSAGASREAAIHVPAGTLTATSNIVLGKDGTELNSSQNTLTIGRRDGSTTATVTTDIVAFRGNSTSGAGLSGVAVANGSTLSVTNGITGVDNILKQISLVDGGTLKVRGTSASGVSVRVYGSGNKIGANGATGTNVTSSSFIDAATTGKGISGVSVSVAGTGYIGPPTIRVTGGSGFGAILRPVWNKTTKEVTGIEVLSPGYGYTIPPTLTFSPMTGAVAPTHSVSIDTNTSSGLIEKIDNDTFLFAADNTLTGVTVTSGTLKIGNAGAAGSIAPVTSATDAGTASIASGATLAFNRNDTISYTGSISGAGGISKESGTVGTVYTLLSGAKTFTGGVSIVSGSLRADNNDSFGTGVGSIAITSGAALELTNNITLSRPVSVAGTGNALGCIRNVSGTNTISGQLTVTGAFTLGAAGGSLNLSYNTGTAIALAANAATILGAGDITIEGVISSTTTAGTLTRSSGTGVLTLNGTNTYTGKTAVTAGTVAYKTAPAPAGASSSLGASATLEVTGAATAATAGGIRFVGAGNQTFARTITIPNSLLGAAIRIEASGAGAVTHTGSITSTTTNQNRTYQFGGTSLTKNVFSAAIAANGTGVISIAKADEGRWVLNNKANSYTGGTTVNGSGSSGSTSTLGLEIATWASGDKVTGTGLVSVGAYAKIQTYTGSGGSAQLGRHRYPAGLTFANNGRIRIGG